MQCYLHLQIEMTTSCTGFHERRALNYTYVLIHISITDNTCSDGTLFNSRYLIILIIWIASISTVVPYMVFLKHTTNSNSTPSCDEDWKHVNHRKTYTVFLFLLQYLIPLLVMAGFFAVTWKELGSYRYNLCVLRPYCMLRFVVQLVSRKTVDITRHCWRHRRCV